MSDIRYYISDMGGVLTTPLRDALDVFVRHVGVTWEELGEGLQVCAEMFGENPLAAVERGTITESQLTDELGRGLSQATGRPIAMDGFPGVFLDAIRPNPPMVDFTRAIKERGFRMALLSNNVREWDLHWHEMLPLDDLFEVIVNSGIEGTRKPEARIYELTLERLGASAQECLFVDDIDANCEAARALGIHAIQFVETDSAIAAIERALRNGYAPGTTTKSGKARSKP